MITSKQRAYLCGLANTIDTILIVGKGGVSQQVINQANEALTAREIVKARALETSGEEIEKIAIQISQGTKSELVRVIGSKFILYRRHAKEPKIELPKAKRAT